MKISLTDLTVRALAPGTYFDTKTPAFGIRVGKHRKTWLVTKGKERAKITLGHYPSLGLADARRRALVALGSPHSALATPTFPDALEEYLSQEGRWRTNTRQITSYILRKHFTWGKPLDKITYQDILAVIDQIPTLGAKQGAIKAIRTFFSWCVPRYVPFSPAAHLKMPAYTSRARVLTDEELKRVWIAADAIGHPFGTIVKLLILTGQRRGEIAALQTSWLQKNVITLPKEVTKNGREHTFPFTQLSLLQLSSPFAGFSFNSWSKSKKQLDKLSKVTNWTLHDLRRTFATGLASLNVPIHVTERILNHISGVSGGLVGVYQKHEYWPEQVSAMTAWENRVLSIVRTG